MYAKSKVYIANPILLTIGYLILFINISINDNNAIQHETHIKDMSMVDQIFLQTSYRKTRYLKR
jgi:BarA-like signal transduction histidine kinase